MSPEMKLTERIKSAKTPAEALMMLAEAIDALAETQQPSDPWSAPLVWVPDADLAPPPPDDGRAQIVNGEVIVKPVSQERQNARFDFAVKARLDEFFDGGLSQPDFWAAYVKGGPRWLYYTDRAAVMSMPRDLRQQLVADVLLDSPEEADEIGRDILKADESADEGTQIDWQRAARELEPLG